MQERANSLLRFLDRYAGIPLIFILGFFRKKRALPSEINRIALLKTAGIGDLVLLTAIIKDLKEKFSSITLFVGSSNEEMAELIPGIEVVKLPITHPLQAIKLLRKTSFDVWLDFGPWPRINALFSYFAKAKYTIGFHSFKEYRHYIYDNVFLHKKDCHELENFRQLLTPFISFPKHLPHLNLPISFSKKVVIHCFKAGVDKQYYMWPKERWICLIDQLTGLGFECLLTGGKEDAKEALALKELCQNKELVSSFAGLLSLKQTTELLAHSFSIISIDTGIMHLAAALQKPVICLHGLASPLRWGAIGKNVFALPKNYIDSKNKETIFSIEVDEVLHTFKEICKKDY